MTSTDVAKLPRRTLRAGARLHRIHRADRAPWYFSNSGTGRFDPIDTPGRGACYWAEAPLGAWVESFRTVRTITPDDLARRSLSTIELAVDLTVRDLTVKRALNAGITMALTGGSDYAPAQRLATRLQGQSDGVRYRVRHDLSARYKAIAWFGDAGVANRRALEHLPLPVTTELPRHLIEDAERLFGYRVLPVPP